MDTQSGKLTDYIKNSKKTVSVHTALDNLKQQNAIFNI